MRLRAYFVLIVLGIFPQLTQARELIYSFELGSAAGLFSSPSSMQGQSLFMPPNLILKLALQNESDFGIMARADSEQKNFYPSSGTTSQLDYAYIWLDLKVVSPGAQVNVGQIPNLWRMRVNSENSASFAFLGRNYSDGFLRWGILNIADRGLAIIQNWHSSVLAVSVVNGEGAEQAETGFHKDFQLFYQNREFNNFQFSLFALDGTHEKVESGMAAKERQAIALQYSKYGFRIYTEFLWSRDPVDAVNRKVVDQVELTDLGGQMVNGFSSNLELEYQLGPKAIGFYRYEFVDPARGVEARGLESNVLGFHYFPRQSLQFSIAWLQVVYGKFHGNSAEDLSELSVGIKYLWPVAATKSAGDGK